MSGKSLHTCGECNNALDLERYITDNENPGEIIQMWIDLSDRELSDGDNPLGVYGKINKIAVMQHPDFKSKLTRKQQAGLRNILPDSNQMYTKCRNKECGYVAVIPDNSLLFSDYNGTPDYQDGVLASRVLASPVLARTKKFKCSTPNCRGEEAVLYHRDGSTELIRVCTTCTQIQ